MGQKRKRPAKAPPKDFVDTKQRVGQKKRLAPNQTRAEVKVKPVKVAEQTSITRCGSKGDYATSRNLTLEELVAQNVTTRREAYLGIRELLDRYPCAFASQLGYILAVLAKTSTDLDDVVRKYHRSVVERILQQLSDDGVGKSHQSFSNRLGPFAERLGLQLRSSMTHRDSSVRGDSLAFVELLMGHRWIDGALMNQIIQASFKGESLKRANESNFEMIAAFVNDLYSRCLLQKFNSRHLSQLFRVGRIALQLLPLSDIPIESNIHRPEEQLSSLISSWTPVTSPSRCVSADIATTAPLVNLLKSLINYWSQLSIYSEQPPPTVGTLKRKAALSNEGRLIFNDFGGSHPNHRASLSPIEETVLMTSASKLDLLKLIYRCLQHLHRSSDKAASDSILLFAPSVTSTGRGQSQIGSRLLNEVLLPAIRSMVCPKAVNRKIFDSIHRQLSMTLIRTFSILLSCSGNESLNPQTASLLVALLSRCITELPELLDAERSSGSQSTQKRCRMFLSSLCDLIYAVRLADYDTSTLLARSVATLADRSPLREESCDDQSPSFLQDAASVRWKKLLDSAMRITGILEDDTEATQRNGSRKRRGFEVLIRNIHEAEDKEQDEEEMEDVLFLLRNGNDLTRKQIMDRLQQQIVKVFDELWEILSSDHIRLDDEEEESSLQQFDDSSSETKSDHESSVTQSQRTSLHEGSSQSYSDQFDDDFGQISPSNIISQKRRKLTTEGHYESVLSIQTNSPNIQSSAKGSWLDIRVSLVPFFAAFMGLPTRDSEFCTGILKWAVERIKEWFPEQMLSSSPTNSSLILKGQWTIQWADLAALFHRVYSRASCFLLNALLALAQELTRLYHKDPSQKEPVTQISRPLLERITDLFISNASVPLSDLPENLQRQILLLAAELALSNPTLQQSIMTDSWVRAFTSESLIFLFIDLVLSCSSVSIALRISFILSIISASGDAPRVSNYCQAHADRLGAQVELELRQMVFDNTVNSFPLKVSDAIV